MPKKRHIQEWNSSSGSRWILCPSNFYPKLIFLTRVLIATKFESSWKSFWYMHRRKVNLQPIITWPTDKHYISLLLFFWHIFVATWYSRICSPFSAKTIAYHRIGIWENHWWLKNHQCQWSKSKKNQWWWSGEGKTIVQDQPMKWENEHAGIITRVKKNNLG